MQKALCTAAQTADKFCFLQSILYIDIQHSLQADTLQRSAHTSSSRFQTIRLQKHHVRQCMSNNCSI